ncbi:Synaptotagmin-like protein 2 [Bagarius yarrelli]|uniref:Synaptotagmin-like protein 2 n=1 Tax=Bagarius yarrelli TaxID=175774 RepID=A0A556UZW5_BAGYA|nr:Synaptotagmin-like protein 2 [Bagarius yarrelli]
MIDLSYLTEEEQEAIMVVLQRDADLKKAEEERVKHLQTQGPEKGKLKYITGEWFYEVKSQRHQDRIHGSDIIMASMKQKKPMTQRHNPFNNIPVDLDFDLTSGALLPDARNSPAELVPSLKSHEESETKTKTKVPDILQVTYPHQKPVPKKRTKYFKAQSSGPDSNSSISTHSVSTNSSVSTQSASTSSSTKSPVSTSSMSTNSDSRSTLSTQSMSTNSEIRPRPPKGILKHSSSYDSSDSNIKSRLPQPNKKKTGHGHILEENAISQERINDFSLSLEDHEPLKLTSSTLPKSRLPVRSSMIVDAVETSQEKPNIQPQLSLSSSTQSNDKQKTSDIQHTGQKCEHSFNLSISTEPEKQNKADEMKKTLSISRTQVRSPFESLLMKPINQSTTPQISPKNQKKEDRTTSKMESEKIEDKLDRPLTISDLLVYKATNPTDASNKTDPCLVASQRKHMLSPFDAKTNRDIDKKTKNCKDPIMVNSKSPKSFEEKGDSIAKVLEWFSRSSDSSDKLDSEDIISETGVDIQIEDIDFEDELNSRPKAENNVYLIIPRQRNEDEAMINDRFLKERDIERELNLDGSSMNSHKKLIHQAKPLSSEEIYVVGASSIFSQRSPEDTTNQLHDPEKTSQKEKLVETFSKKEESKHDNKAEIQESKPTQHELQDLIDSQSPNITNWKSLSDQDTTEAPAMLVHKPSENSELENLDQFNFDRNVAESEGQTKIDISPTFSLLDYKEQSHEKDISNADEIKADNTYEHLNKKEAIFRVEANDIQQLINNTNQKDLRALSSTPDKYDTRRLSQTSSSQEFEFQIENNSNANVGVNVNSDEEGCSTATVPELEPKVKTKKKETHLKDLPTSGVEFQQQNPVQLANQSNEQENNRTEKIKELKSFWEKEKLQSKIYMKSATSNNTKSSLANTKLNKRLSKSEYDLTSIDTELEAETVHFTVLPLRDRIENTVTEEGMTNSQFKMLLEFWGGSEKSHNFKNRNQKPHKERLLTKNACPNESEKGSGNDCRNTMPAKADKEQTGDKHPDISARANLHISPPDFLRSSNCPQPMSGLQSSSKDIESPKPPPMLSRESQPQMRSSGKGALNGRGDSLRRATSMYSINLESQDQDLPLHSQDVSDTVFPALETTTESVMLPSTKTPEVHTSPEITKNKQKVTVSGTSTNPESHPLARSFVPQDYQHYLGITEDSDSLQVTEPTNELVCTSFQTDDGARCCPEQADAHLDFANLCTSRESLGLAPGLHANEDFNSETLNRSDSFSRASANFTEVSLVQEVLKRASTRPVYHKSLEDITAVPLSSAQSPLSFSDKEHLRKISKSVPCFLDNENDRDESDSECSSHSGNHSNTNSLQDELNSDSRVDTVSWINRSISRADCGRVDVQGTIQFSINYVQKLKEVHIFVVQCQNLSAVDVKRNRSDPYVKSYLIPDTANLGKRKSSVKKKTLNPTFNEILRYRVRIEYLKTQILNLSVWHNDTFGRNSFLGQTEIDLSTWDFENTRPNCFSLKPRTMSSFLSTDDRGEMRLAMRFLPHISHYKSVQGSGEIHIWVRDCKNLPMIRGVAINTYVKCLVLPDTSINSCQKTRVLKRTLNPVFNHTMVYDGFMTEDLKEACVELTVWNHDKLSDYLVGGLRLSLGSGQSYGTDVDWMDSDAKEVDLWQRMMDSPNEWVEDVLPLRVLTSAKNTWK